jgi:hypothetical protein
MMDIHNWSEDEYNTYYNVYVKFGSL